MKWGGYPFVYRSATNDHIASIFAFVPHQCVVCEQWFWLERGWLLGAWSYRCSEHEPWGHKGVRA